MSWGHLLRLVFGISYSFFFILFFLFLGVRVFQISSDFPSWFLFFVSVSAYACFVQIPATAVFGRIFLQNFSEVIGDD